MQAYKTFKDCFDDIRSGKRDKDQISAKDVKEYKEKFESEEFQGAMSFITYFEKSFSCSGICSSSMFYYTLSLSMGPPNTTCLAHMKEKV